jgi:hypothetical protein
MIMKTLLAHSLLLVLIVLPVQAETLTFKSPQQQATLVELYTSEGCSSCPPADRWFSRLLQDKRLWQQLVPVAFHVDYWNYLGWKDRFSRPAFSQRQRSLARQGNIRSVYTPGLVKAGREWRSWYFSRHLGDLWGEDVGILQITIDDAMASSRKQAVIQARFHPAYTLTSPLTLNVALLGFGLESPIRAGENEGKILRHDFVVLRLLTREAHKKGDGYAWTLALPAQAGDTPAYDGLAAWVTKVGVLTPIQATGGRLP